MAPDLSFAGRYLRTRLAVRLFLVACWLALPLSGMFQIDIAHVRLVLAGRPWPPLRGDLLPAEALTRGAPAHWEIVAPVLLQGVLPVALLAIAFLITARYFGRLHCGFVCTYGFLAETGEGLFQWARRPVPGRRARLALAWAIVAGAAPGVAFTLLSLFVRPQGVVRGLMGHDPAIAVPFALFTLLALAMGGLVRLRFCRYVCGVGLVQTLAWMTHRKALEVGFNPTAAPDGSRGSMRDCTGCHACREVCPIGLDPRQPKRYMLACFQCGRCLQACEEELHPLGRGAALGFHFHEPDYPLPAQEVHPPAPRSAHDHPERTSP